MKELLRSFPRFNQDCLRFVRMTTASVSKQPAKAPILAQGGACGQKARKIFPPCHRRRGGSRTAPTTYYFHPIRSRKDVMCAMWCRPCQATMAQGISPRSTLPSRGAGRCAQNPELRRDLNSSTQRECNDSNRVRESSIGAMRASSRAAQQLLVVRFNSRLIFR